MDTDFCYFSSFLYFSLFVGSQDTLYCRRQILSSSKLVYLKKIDNEMNKLFT